MSHAPRIEVHANQLVTITGCTCGWKPTPGDPDTEHAYAYHVGLDRYTPSRDRAHRTLV